MESLGKYQLIRKIATGGMAEVFLAKAAGPKGFQKKLVVKRILPHLAQDPQFVEMFLGEATLAASLDHPNLVQLFDFGEVGGTYFIAMELIDGPNLRALKAHAKAKELDIPFGTCAKIVGAACEGLHFAHEARHPDTDAPLNLIHRDISPDNILLSKSGAVKVVDFGIAKASTQVHLTKSGVIKGKMAYMPPEQLRRQELDRRVDVYALGVVLYELLAGTLPFDATSEVSIIQAIMSSEPLPPITSARPDCPEELARIVARALHKDRALRYESCLQLQTELERFIHSTGRPVHARDLAELVGALDIEIAPPDAKATPAAGQRQVVIGDAEAPMLSKTHSPVRAGVALVDTDVDNAFAETSLSSPRAGVVSPSATPRRSLGPILAVFVAVALLGAALGYLLKQGPAPASPAPAPPPVEEPVAAPVEAEDAGPELAESPPTLNEPEAPDAGAAVTVAAVTKRAAGKSRPSKQSTPRGQATLEFRVRPYATVYLDGKTLGQTPMPAVSVGAGKHTIRLVNPKLDKDVTVDFLVRAGEANVFKYNLKE